jgi:myo-inositol-1(or 4)-monophosphatase
MLDLLERLFHQVRSYVHSERFDRSKIYSESSGHITMQFDRDAEDILIQGLVESGVGFEILTEERPLLSTAPTPTYRIVIDPIDGSTNVKRGILTAAVALAVLPIDAPILPEYVQWALVGELFSGTIYQAQRGYGAFCNGQQCKVSQARHIQQCVVGLNLDGRERNTLQALLLQEPPLGQVRRSGSSAMDIAYVANGAYDAYIDVGDILTGESFLASLSIVVEAGGVASDHHGKALRPVPNLSEGFSLIVAGTPELHSALLRRIGKGTVS